MIIQSVTGWQNSARGATVPPGKTKRILWGSGSVFIVIRRGGKLCWHCVRIKMAVLKYLLSEWFFTESMAVSIFCITTARDP